MKAISAPRTGVDVTDRAERGLRPFNLGPPDLPSPSLPTQGGEGGQGVWRSTGAPSVQDGSIEFVKLAACLGSHGSVSAARATSHQPGRSFPQAEKIATVRPQFGVHPENRGSKSSRPLRMR